MTTAPKRSEVHKPGLDGVRGVAIVAVFALHFTYGLTTHPNLQSIASWGWAGVDLFFVLSGYLITGILIDTQQSAIYYLSFYGRRVLRIAPAYMLFMLALLTVAPFTGLMTPAEHASLVDRQGWYWSYLVNVLVSRFGWDGAPFATSHLWSLAVEEQFYLIWPFCIACVKTPARTVRLALAVIAGAAALRLTITLTGWSQAALTNYMLMPCRADALAWGALLAGLERWHREWLLWLWPRLLIAGATLLGFVVLRLHSFGFQSPSMQVLGYPAIGMASAGIVGFALVRSSTWFEYRPLRFLGKYSYSTYLWHAVIIFVTQRALNVPWPVSAVISVVGTSILVAVSWIFVEQPALSLKRFLPRHSSRVVVSPTGVIEDPSIPLPPA